MKYRLIAMVLTCLCLAGCKDPQLNPGQGTSPFPGDGTNPYPLKRTIRDSSGRPLDGTIVGKVRNSIFVRRNADGMEFEIPIAKLLPQDKAFAEELPIAVPPAGFAGTGDLRENTEEGKGGIPPYILSREEEIQRLKDKNKLLYSEIDATTNQMIVRTKLTEVKKNEKEIYRLRADIIQFEQNNK